ncbi:MAG: 6-carboxytetrahydropterin synthase [Raoultibacter sp.]|jgi:6-pyruvoyltetrahydropterin/6-carboxytetrahydropterin synthase
MRKAVLFTDGGSRGNPGPSGLGFHLRDEQSSDIARGGWYLERATNNEAEYSALVWGLENAFAAEVDSLEIFADSELIVKQMQGIYQVKSNDLKPLFLRAKALFTRFESVSIRHVYRAENAEADLLANEAMDARHSVGEFLIPWESGPKNLFDTEEPVITASEEDFSSKASPHDKAESCGVPYRTAALSGRSFERESGHYEICIKEQFEASYVIRGYDGPLRNNELNAWEVEAKISGEQLDSIGILYDFKTLASDLRAILNNFNQGCINDVEPFNQLNPTSENLARVIYHELDAVLPESVSVGEVAVWEGPSARVSYSQ